MKKIILCLCIIILLPLLVGAKDYNGEHYYTLESSFLPKINNIEEELILQQKYIDEKILTDYKNGNYTIDNPYIKVNPYNINKLSAIIFFNTNELAKVAVEVTGDIPVNTFYDNYITDHKLQVAGLYSGDNLVKIKIIYQSGKIEERILKIVTDALPEELNEITTVKDVKDNELTYTIPTGKHEKYYYLLDSVGKVRFFIENAGFTVETQFTEDGTMLLAPRNITSKGNIEGYANGIVEMNYLGRIINYYKVPFEVHHDFIELPNKNLLVTTSDNSIYDEDTIIELDRKTGKIVDQLDLKDILDYNRMGFLGIQPKDRDWFHSNSIEYDASDNSIIISGRHQCVVKIDKKTKKIKWILSDPSNWSDEYQKYLLKPLGNTFEYPYGQHSAKLNEQGNLILYDNGNNRTLNPNEVNEKPLYSRAVEYEINEKDMTIKQVWSYGKERGQELYTPFIGSIRQLENQNYLICFGGIVKDIVDNQGNKIQNQTAKIIEVNPKTNEIINETTIKDAMSHKADKVNINTVIKNNIVNSEDGSIKYDEKYYGDSEKDFIDVDCNGVKIFNYINKIDASDYEDKVGIRYTIIDSKNNIVDKQISWIENKDIKEENLIRINTEKLSKGKYKIIFDLININEQSISNNTIIKIKHK